MNNTNLYKPGVGTAPDVIKEVKPVQGVPQKPGPRFELRFFRMKSLFLSAYLFLPKKEFVIVNENIQHYIRSVIIRKDGRMFKHEV